MDDKSLEKFWNNNQPENFDGWEEVSLKFKRPHKKLGQLRLEPGDVRFIDRESKKTGIDRAQLVRTWVKEKIREFGYFQPSTAKRLPPTGRWCELKNLLRKLINLKREIHFKRLRKNLYIYVRQKFSCFRDRFILSAKTKKLSEARLQRV